jgi:hypothetical protein
MSKGERTIYHWAWDWTPDLATAQALALEWAERLNPPNPAPVVFIDHQTGEYTYGITGWDVFKACGLHDWDLASIYCFGRWQACNPKNGIHHEQA